MAKIGSVKLPGGVQMPMLGFGTWKLATDGQVDVAVKTAIDVGYRHIDCAYAYQNEAEVGAAIKSKIDSGVVTRKDLFVVSKLWSTFHSASRVKLGFMESLNKLGLSYMDLFLMHWPYAFKAGDNLLPKDENDVLIYEDIHPLETWREMEKLVDQGLVKHIGLANFAPEQIQNIWDNSRIKPAVIQDEVNPYFQNDEIVNLCHTKGIVITAYSPFASPDKPWGVEGEPRVLDEPKLAEIAKRYNKTPAQIILRWLLQRNITVIPKSATPSRIQQNFEVSDFKLSDSDMTAIKALETNKRMVMPFSVKPGEFAPHNVIGRLDS